MPAEDLVLPGTGTVLKPFPFHFEYPITESFEFYTDIIEADDGTEQRIAVRDPARPRQHVAAHVIAFDRDEYAQLKALLFGWNLNSYGVPLWFHAMRLVADASMGDTEVTVDSCDGRDLTDRIADEEDVPVLLWRAHDDWEPAILADASGGTLTFRDGLARDWAGDGRTVILPLALMLVATDPLQLDAPANAIAELDLEFVSAHYTISANACDSAEGFARALMVRPTGTMKSIGGSGYDATNEYANAASLHPQSTDLVHNLFGFSAGVKLLSIADPGKGMYSASKGRATGFARCTSKCPDAFTEQILGVGLSSYTGDFGGGDAPVVGTDYEISVMQGAPAQDFPAGVPIDGFLVVASGFTGTGYFPPPGAPTGRSWVLSRLTLIGGVCRTFLTSSGSEVTSYGVYDDMVMGGIANTTLQTEAPMPANFVDVAHGFCVRLMNIADFTGVQIVTEEVLYEMDGVTETGTFGTPNVTTHDFTSDDYTAADTGAPPPGFFFSVPAGGTTVFGGAHDTMGTAGKNGYNHGTDHELYRVTVSLYDADDVMHQQFIDIFPTMLISAVMGS